MIKKDATQKTCHECKARIYSGKGAKFRTVAPFGKVALCANCNVKLLVSEGKRVAIE